MLNLIIIFTLFFSDVYDLQKFDYPWPTPDMVPLYRNFTPADLHDEISSTPVKHAVFVQCLNASPQESSELTIHYQKYSILCDSQFLDGLVVS